jgi:hypothetical protein
MPQERTGAASRILIEMFRRECYPDGFPDEMPEEELSARFVEWVEQNAEKNETVANLHQLVARDFDIEQMEAALSSPEGQAAGFRSIMRPNADGTITQLWTKQTPDEPKPEPDAKDPARN